MALDLNQNNLTQPLLKYLRQQRENRRFIDGIEIAITFFIIALFGFIAIKPTFLTISLLIGENKAKAEAVASMKNKINNIVKAQDNFAKIQDDYLLIESSLPSSPNYSDIATQIEGTANKTGLTLSGINFSLNEVDTSLSISSGSKSTFNASTNFVSNLLKNRRLLDFSSINFSVPKQSENENTNNVGFSFSISFLNFTKK